MARLALVAFLSFATVTFAADAEQRFDSGPLFSQADAGGKFSAYVFPEVLGKRHGRGDYRVYAGSCDLQIDFGWGVRPPDQ